MTDARRGSGRRRSPKQHPPRVVVGAILPEIDAGRFPAKATAGEMVTVRAYVYADSHDALSVDLLHRAAGADEWERVPMAALGNDEFEASFVAGAPGPYEYSVEAWINRFESWRVDLEKRIAAGWDVESELLEGALLIETWARPGSPDDEAALRAAAVRLRDGSIEQSERAVAALDADLAAAMAHSPNREQATRYERDLPLTVDRERTRFGAWYEMFPRSATPDPTRSATFTEAAERLPDIAAMGFDVLYLPPIHPIGRTNRKGPNNTLHATPGDPGSPWAIGSAEGGHMAVHPDLGTLDDFGHFREAAADAGLEIALDLAFQCSPDHPWVSEHPTWFRQRPDGTIRYAENPPKQYQDIYPLDFETEDWPGLWQALLEVVQFWIRHGVRIFRVDNPHTKPFSFWEWLISMVQRDDPEVIFLAEAFTRPKRLEGLAKLGFSQSYSYFTWRNSKAEIVEYLSELNEAPRRHFLRPNLFANTPDILHEYLQVGGRPAFLARLVLAATLGPSYGIYSGFELCEHEAVPGTEEYFDSEKYQIKPRDWDAPSNIKPEITRINRLRAELPALQHSHDLWFLPIENEQIVAYVKGAPHGGGHVLVVVNVDAARRQEGWVGLPLDALRLGADEPFVVNDVFNDERLLWRGEWNHVALDPATVPARIFTFEGRVHTEQQAEQYQ